MGNRNEVTLACQKRSPGFVSNTFYRESPSLREGQPKAGEGEVLVQLLLALHPPLAALDPPARGRIATANDLPAGGLLNRIRGQGNCEPHGFS